ncbi:MAG TPA: xanthine dehydrogenase family protein subunit M [Polyangiaceae bacterium]|jgi:xanthine dehydrogenase YagS FAD-binding subunit
MRAFDYLRASDVETAQSSGSKPDARFIAGGTTLVDLLRLNVERPALLVDLARLPWSTLEPVANGVRIGALLKNTELAYHPLVVRDYAVLSQALLAGASPQIRNMASVGGNLLQRTRCSYFRDVAVEACNKRSPGSGCAAREGYSRAHAVLGGSPHCIAVNPSDMCVALAALEATIELQGPRGSRHVAIADFHTLPGDHPEIESVLEPGELVTSVLLPATTAGRQSAYVKARDRASFAFALASAAVVLDLDGKQIRRARVALGGVATKPWRCPETENALVGKSVSATTFAEAASHAASGAVATNDNRFKIRLAERVVAQALAVAAGTA